jgi:HlyD family secretion protein
MTRRWTWIVAVLSVVAAGTWTSHSFHRASDVSVASAVVTRGPIVRAIVATGTLQPVSAVQVGAQISGTIDALFADYNSIVHKQPVVKVWRRTETGAAPRRQGATTENTGSI